VAELCEREPDRKILVSDIKSSKAHPVVYAWMHEGIPIYIGCTRDFFARIFTHEILGRFNDFKDTDEVILWYCRDMNDALELEKSLIKKFSPKYNTVYNSIKRQRQKQLRGEQKLQRLIELEKTRQLRALRKQERKITEQKTEKSGLQSIQTNILQNVLLPFAEKESINKKITEILQEDPNLINEVKAQQKIKNT